MDLKFNSTEVTLLGGIQALAEQVKAATVSLQEVRRNAAKALSKFSSGDVVEVVYKGKSDGTFVVADVSLNDQNGIMIHFTKPENLASPHRYNEGDIFAYQADCEYQFHLIRSNEQTDNSGIQ